jgi:hypothetical protein
MFSGSFLIQLVDVNFCCPDQVFLLSFSFRKTVTAFKISSPRFFPPRKVAFVHFSYLIQHFFQVAV